MHARWDHNGIRSTMGSQWNPICNEIIMGSSLQRDRHGILSNHNVILSTMGLQWWVKALDIVTPMRPLSLSLPLLSVIARPPWIVTIADALPSSMRQSPASISSLHLVHLALLLDYPASTSTSTLTCTFKLQFPNYHCNNNNYCCHYYYYY